MAADPIDKARRHQAIMAVLRLEEVESQEALRRALKRRGFPVTQATLSRDLKELRIPCVPTETGYRYVIPDEAGGTVPAAPAPKRLLSVASIEVKAIDANETGVIVRTLTGRAQGVAVYIDGLAMLDVLATIAGDDSILVLPRTVKRTEKVRRQLERLFELD